MSRRSHQDELPHFATPQQAMRRQRYNLYQQQQQQQQQAPPLYRQQAPLQLQQPNGLPRQSTGEDAKDYEHIKQVFISFDADRSGLLSVRELARALYNADGTRFDSSTIQLMMKLFDSDNSQTLDFREFYFLTKYLRHWNTTFQRADANRSGTISLSEYSRALENFGYRMHFDSVNYIFNLFASQQPQQPQRTSGFGMGGPPPVPGMGNSGRFNPNHMKFDKFVESLIWILRLTGVFRKYDLQGNATATFGFEPFMCEVLSLVN